jgi:endogenous inhibitor of DNA gyrase (YacG/DUF329 family)
VFIFRWPDGAGDDSSLPETALFIRLLADGLHDASAVVGRAIARGDADCANEGDDLRHFRRSDLISDYSRRCRIIDLGDWARDRLSATAPQRQEVREIHGEAHGI